MAQQGSTKFLFLRRRDKSKRGSDASFSINEVGLQAKKIEVDNEGSIEHEVNDFHPTHVVIESIWVNPERFAILTHIYPHIMWIIRVMPEAAAIVRDGMGKEWLLEYVKYKNVFVKLCT